ncbi:MAG: translation elongation factor Ts [Phycisphaeraceae bacterium]
MAITAKDVKSLRDRTGLGMMECKQALAEVEGDVDKAVDLLRQRGLSKMDTRSDRTSAEGRVAAIVSEDRSRGAIVELNTETDFTANNDQFVAMTDAVTREALKHDAGPVEPNDAIKAAIDEVRLTTKENVQFARGHVLGGGGSTVGAYVHFTGKVGVIVELAGEASDELLKDLCMHISAVSPVPVGVHEDEVPESIIDKERQVAKAQAMEQGKPENIAEKMVEGKIRKFYDEHVLLRQPFIKDDKQQIKDLLPKGTTIERFVRYQVGG